MSQDTAITDLRVGDRVLTNKGSVGIVEQVLPDEAGKWGNLTTPQPWPLVMAAVEETDDEGRTVTRHVSHWAHTFSLVPDDPADQVEDYVPEDNSGALALITGAYVR